MTSYLLVILMIVFAYLFLMGLARKLDEYMKEENDLFD